MDENAAKKRGELAEKPFKIPSERALARCLSRLSGVPDSTIRHWLRTGEWQERLHFSAWQFKNVRLAPRK